MSPTQETVPMRQLGTIKRCMRFSLQCNQTDLQLGLVMAINPDDDEMVGVKALIIPVEPTQYLPQGIHFRLQSHGKLLQDLCAARPTQSLEIPYFRGGFGETFNLEVQLETETFNASFQI